MSGHKGTDADIDKIIDKFCSDLKKRLTVLINRKEKRLTKEMSIVNKTTKKPVRKETNRRKHSESNSSRESSSRDSRN